MKIAIAGTGYVGLSNAILLAKHNEVVAVDIVAEKVDMINNRISPIVDTEIEYYLANEPLNLVATTDMYEAYQDATVTKREWKKMEMNSEGLCYFYNMIIIKLIKVFNFK